MAGMQAVYYRAPDGSEPVDEFVERLSGARKQAALDNQIDRLNMLRQNDPPLPFPGARSSRVSSASFACTTALSCTESSTAARATCSSFCTCSERTLAGCRRPSFRSRANAGRTSRHGWTPSAGGRRGRLGATLPEPCRLSHLVSYGSPRARSQHMSQRKARARSDRRSPSAPAGGRGEAPPTVRGAEASSSRMSSWRGS